MSLGRSEETLEQDIAVARLAMEAGVWFHSSPTYNRGFTYMVLRHAFDEARHQVPRLILKLRDGSPKLLRFEAEDACRRLGIEAIDVAQLVSMQRGPGCLTDQLLKGGPIADELSSLRQRGLIKQAVIFVDRDNSDAGVAALASQLVDGLTLYWNACQQFPGDQDHDWRDGDAESSGAVPYLCGVTQAAAGRRFGPVGCARAGWR